MMTTVPLQHLSCDPFFTRLADASTQSRNSRSHFFSSFQDLTSDRLHLYIRCVVDFLTSHFSLVTSLVWTAYKSFTWVLCSNIHFHLYNHQNTFQRKINISSQSRFHTDTNSTIQNARDASLSAFGQRSRQQPHVFTRQSRIQAQGHCGRV